MSRYVSGFSFQATADGLGHIFEAARLGNGHGQIIEPIGKVLDRRRVVDHRRRHLVGSGLALVAGLGLVADLEFLDVDPDLPIGPLAEPEAERGSRAVDDRGAGDHRGCHNR